MKRFLIWLLLAVVVSAAVAVSCRGSRVLLAADKDSAPKAGFMDSAYDADRQLAAFRSALASNDTFTTTAILATPAFHPLGRTTLSVGARFSAASQTCQVQVVYIYKTGDTQTVSDTDQTKNTIKGYSPVVTLTGGATQYEGSYYPAPDYFFDMNRSTMIRVLLITKPVSGTVDLWLGS